MEARYVIESLVQADTDSRLDTARRRMYADGGARPVG